MGIVSQSFYGNPSNSKLETTLYSSSPITNTYNVALTAIIPPSLYGAKMTGNWTFNYLIDGATTSGIYVYLYKTVNGSAQNPYLYENDPGYTGGSGSVTFNADFFNHTVDANNTFRFQMEPSPTGSRQYWMGSYCWVTAQFDVPSGGIVMAPLQFHLLGR